MITKRHIEIYKTYNGDSDGWVRVNSNEEQIMTYDIWRQIEGFIQNLTLINKGLASDGFKAQTIHYLNAVCQDEEVVKQIKNMVE